MTSFAPSPDRPETERPAWFLADAVVGLWLFVCFAAFSSGDSVSPWRAILFGLSFATFDRLLAQFIPGLAPRLRLVLSIASLLLASLAAAWMADSYAANAGEVVWLCLAATGLCLAQRASLEAARRAGWPPAAELVRWCLLAFVAFLLYLPYFQADAVGGTGSSNAALPLADFAAQWRRGVFPVWIGQSAYEFAGAVHPIRSAPFLPHLAGLIDLISVRSLSPLGLRNAAIAVTGLLTAFSGYFSLRTLAPRRPWSATILALLWFASPGVVTVPEMADRYLTAAALVFAPIILASLFAVWRSESRVPRLLLAAGLAGAWAASPDIAFWLSVATIVILAVRVATDRSPARWRLLGFFAACFGVLAVYPLVSRLLLTSIDPATAAPAQVEYNLTHAVRWLFRAVRVDTPTDYAFAPGLVLWGLFLASVPIIFLRRISGAWIFLAGVLTAIVVLIPIPHVTDRLWYWLPRSVVLWHSPYPAQTIAGLWNFCMVATAAVALAIFDRLPARTSGAILAAVFVLALWGSAGSVIEVNRRLMATDVVAPEAAAAVDPRNLQLHEVDYRYLPDPTTTISSQYIDPEMENALAERQSSTRLVSNLDAAAPRMRGENKVGFPSRLIQLGALTAERVEGNAYRITTRLSLPAGIATALRIEAADPQIQGDLTVTSADFHRVYRFPLGATPVIPFRAGRAQDVELSFTSAREASKLDLGRFWLFTYEPTDLPVSVYSLIPYKADVNAPVEAWVETHRRWQPGYSARVNGTPALIAKSAGNFVLVAVPPGKSKVWLTYSPPLVVVLSYWVCLAAWITLLAAGLSALFRPVRQSP